jgi:hypothetical protein
MLIALINRGSGDLDHAAIFTFIDEMAPQPLLQS